MDRYDGAIGQLGQRPVEVLMRPGALVVIDDGARTDTRCAGRMDEQNERAGNQGQRAEQPHSLDAMHGSVRKVQEYGH